MPDNRITIEFKVDLKDVQPALQQAASTVQEHTDDMAKQFKKLAKESRSAIEDMEKAAKLADVDISDEMKSVLDQLPKLASGVADLFSGGGVLAFIGVLLEAGKALKGLYEDVVLLKGAKQEWAEIDKKLAEVEETLNAKIRQNAIEHIRQTQGSAAAAHAALAMADQEVVGFGKNIEQILSGKKVDKLSEGLKKDLEGLNKFTFAELQKKITDVQEAIKRGSQGIADKKKEIAEAENVDMESAAQLATLYDSSIQKGEGELDVLRKVLETLQKVQEAHKTDKDNQQGRAHELDVQAFEQAQRKQMEGFKQRLQEQKNALDAFHTMSSQDEVKYWDSVLATHKLKGQNLKEVRELRWEAQKEADRQGLADEVEKVREAVAASKSGSQERVQILNDELAKMRANHQDQTAEYKRLEKERNQAVQDEARKELKDEVEKVEEQVKKAKAGSQERIKILGDEILKLEALHKTDTEEYKRLVREKEQAERDFTKELEAAEEERQKSRQQHGQALKELARSNLDFQLQIGKIGESEYEARLKAEIDTTFVAARKELEIERDRYEKGSKDYEKYQAQIVKLTDKYNADIEKAEQKAYLRRRQQFDQYFKQVSSSFNTALNGWMQGTESASQAFGKMFQDILSQLINFVEQWIEKKVEMWLMDKLLSQATQSAAAEAQIVSNAAVAYSGAYAATAAIPIVGPGLAPEAAMMAYMDVIAMTPAGFALGGIVPATGLALVHEGEKILPKSMSGDGSGLGGITVVVNHSVNAVDAESFQGHIRRHGNMIGNEVARVLKRKGLAYK